MDGLVLMMESKESLCAKIVKSERERFEDDCCVN